LGVGFERCEDKGGKSAPMFIPSSNYHKEETIKSTKAHYPCNPKPSFNPKREVRKEILSRDRKLLCACFVAVLVTWMSFASIVRELRRDALTVLETHIVMSSLIFRLVLILMLCLTLLMLCLISLMDLTISHMVLVNKRIALCLDTLVMAHAHIMVIVSHIGPNFLMEGLTSSLSLDTWMVHVIPIVVLVPLVQRLMCKRQ
jgi:hypothetical protein